MTVKCTDSVQCKLFHLLAVQVHILSLATGWQTWEDCRTILTYGIGKRNWAMLIFFFRGIVILFGNTKREAMRSWSNESDKPLKHTYTFNVNHSMNEFKADLLSLHLLDYLLHTHTQCTVAHKAQGRGRRTEVLKSCTRWGWCHKQLGREKKCL